MWALVGLDILLVVCMKAAARKPTRWHCRLPALHSLFSLFPCMLLISLDIHILYGFNFFISLPCIFAWYGFCSVTHTYL